MIETAVIAQSSSNFTCELWIMRGGTLLILDHGVKGEKKYAISATAIYIVTYWQKMSP